ncbi:MAG: MaoC family dehydratase [Acidobacteriota bacterium]|nr:MaoC family dehydratase [Acidobacteriota bacterium]
MNHYTWSDLSLGMQAQFEVTLQASMLDAFAALSGDTNPLHQDEQIARQRGFPGRVAFGMLTSAFYSQLAGVHLPGSNCLLHGIDIEFRNPAFVGDTLTVSGEITFLNEAYHRLEIKAAIRNQQGKPISKAVIRAGIHAA